jgi:hypothetical protein
VIQIAVLIVGIALPISLGWMLLGSADPLDRRRVDLMFLLGFAVAIAARDMWDRPDPAHTGFSMLTVAIVFGALSAPVISGTGARRSKSRSRGLVLVVAIVVFLGWVFGGPRQAYSRVSSLGDRGPVLEGLRTLDVKILPSEIAAFADWYRSEFPRGECLLVLTNEGVLNYAVDLPPCGGFFYPIYASVPTGDRMLADWLSANPQTLAVLETHFWSDKIDGKAMPDRLPQLWAVIEERMSGRRLFAKRVFAIRQ